MWLASFVQHNEHIRSSAIFFTHSNLYPVGLAVRLSSHIAQVGKCQRLSWLRNTSAWLCKTSWETPGEDAKKIDYLEKEVKKQKFSCSTWQQSTVIEQWEKNGNLGKRVITWSWKQQNGYFFPQLITCTSDTLYAAKDWAGTHGQRNAPRTQLLSEVGVTKPKTNKFFLSPEIFGFAT